MPHPLPSCPLHCQGIAKRFGSRTLFSKLDFQIEAGERVALIGASGEGKSTLLHCLSGVTGVDEGGVWLTGQELSVLDRDALAHVRREQVGTVFQFFHLLPTLTVYENIELPLQLAEKPEPERKQRITALLSRMDIADRAEAFPSQLSGGEMQRVAIARAIAHRPTILFADEPTGNLDRKNGEAVLQLLEEITAEENTSLLMVTHSEEAARICSRKLRLSDGSIASL